MSSEPQSSGELFNSGDRRTGEVPFLGIASSEAIKICIHPLSWLMVYPGPLLLANAPGSFSCLEPARPTGATISRPHPRRAYIRTYIELSPLT
jgi:hypothetical protein